MGARRRAVEQSAWNLATAEPDGPEATTRRLFRAYHEAHSWHHKSVEPFNLARRERERPPMTRNGSRRSLALRVFGRYGEEP